MRIRTALAMWVLAASVSRAAFDEHTLALTQGLEPTIDSIGIGGVYTGAVDTSVDRHSPDTTFYDADPIRFGLNDGTMTNWAGNGDDRTRGYLRFENFASYLPAKAVVTGARLILTSAGTEGGASYNAFIGYRTASFGTNITWTTAGTKTDNVVTIGAVCSWTLHWPAANVQTVNVTALARAWAEGTLANHGWQFTGVEDSGWDGIGYRFYSSECATPANRPRLEVDYVVADGLTYSNRSFRRVVLATNGPLVIADTVIDSRAANSNQNYSAAASCTLEAWTESLRALFLLQMTNSVLAGIAQSNEDADRDRPWLKGARLQLQSTGVKMAAAVKLWRVAESWDPSLVTYATRDGSTPWANAWALNGQNINNVSPSTPVATAASGAYISSLTLNFDMTAVLQAYADGSNNLGFVAGNENWYGYSDNCRLSEAPTPLFRPTLVMELWYLNPKGTVILVQ